MLKDIKKQEINKLKHRFYNIGTGKKIDLITIAGLVNEVASKKSEIIVKNKFKK